MIVELTLEQLELARRTGRQRNAQHRQAGRPSQRVLRPSDTSVGIDEQGAIAELAVALALGLPWSGRVVAPLASSSFSASSSRPASSAFRIQLAIVFASLSAAREALL